jgi:hypothetical protein
MFRVAEVGLTPAPAITPSTWKLAAAVGVIVAKEMTSADQVMKDAGWYAGRATDINEDLAVRAKAGYHLSAAGAAVLSEVSGLVFRIVRNGRPDSIWFDARKAITWTTPETVRALERQLEGRLVPVGYAYRDHLLLLVSEAGRLVATYDDYTADLGASPRGAIARLVSQDLPNQQSGQSGAASG